MWEISKEIKYIIWEALKTDVPNLKKEKNYYQYLASKIMYTDWYVDNMTYEEYKENLMKSNTYKKVRKKLTALISFLYNQCNQMGLKNTRKALESNIMDLLLYKKWLGFKFEYKIKCELEKNGYEVAMNDLLDRKYAIDLLIKVNENKIIGIQCKADSFEFGSDYSKDYIAKNESAIRNNVANEIYYLFHTIDSENIAKINNKCAFGSYILVPKEKIVDNRTEKNGAIVSIDAIITEMDKIKKLT